MIMPDFILPSRVNQRLKYSGIDSLEYCYDKKHFESYPYDITYQYNSRGFRDSEWPNNVEELQSAIWCVGDSFTVGLGSPLDHTWVYQVNKQINRRTINVSMDGASNMWIARKSLDIINKIQPANMIIQWSYISRREKSIDETLKDYWPSFYATRAGSDWPACPSVHNIDKLPKNILEKIDQFYGGWGEHVIFDGMRILHSINCSVEDDIRNTLECIGLLSQATSTQIVHSFIPRFVPSTHRGVIESQIDGLVIPEIWQLDTARDGHHYDIITSQTFVQQIAQHLS